MKELDNLNPDLLAYVYQFFMDMISQLGNTSSKKMKIESRIIGNFSEDEKPSDFSGIWESPVPNANQIRKEAWQIRE